MKNNNKIGNVLSLALLITALLFSCDGVDDPYPTSPNGGLPDVNATSPTFGRYVLPVDYKGRVSAWYFGHST